MHDVITYEHPLNERVRNFLRLEHLFSQADHYIDNASEWDSRCTLSTLLEVIDFLGRLDIKTELIKEMERHVNTLKALENSPAVDANRLVAILDEISTCLKSLRDKSYQPGQVIRQNEFITSIKQRNTIPGGSCSFDLPQFYYWLNKTPSTRIDLLKEWQSDLNIIKKSINLCLQMIRNSTNPSKEIAENGFFQKPIESNVSCQLIRVRLPMESIYYPEISGGKHRFTIRFMSQEFNTERPSQTLDNVQFELHCCIL